MIDKMKNLIKDKIKNDKIRNLHFIIGDVVMRNYPMFKYFNNE